MRARRIAISLAIAALLTLGLLLSRDARRGGPPEVSSAPSLSAGAIPKPEIPIGDRQKLDVIPALFGSIKANDGTLISGAMVRWLSLEREDHDETPSWAIDSLGPAPRPTIETLTDEQGRYEFRGLPCPLDEFGTVVVASAPGFVPQSRLIDRPAKTGVSYDLILSHGPMVQVQVVDARGDPVPNATVSHYDSSAHVGEQLRSVESRYLSQTGITDSNGRVVLSAFAGEQSFVATSGRTCSLPWKGIRPVSVKLILVPTFSVEGSVAYPDRGQWEPEYEGERRVEVACREGGMWRTIAVQRNIETEFRLASVPISSRAHLYRLRLQGAPVVTEDRFFTSPREGAKIAYDFAALKGASAYLFIEDESGKPITNATARVSWEVDGATREVSGASRADGYLYCGTFPPGSVRVQVEAPGFASFAWPYSLPVDYALLIRLERSHGLRGICQFEGEPVQNFDLIFWKNESLGLRSTRAFRNSQDGAFELELSAGTWLIQAASDEHPACKAVAVQVPPSSEKQVELVLQKALLGGGVVLDAESGEPIDGAQVQALSGDDKDRTLRWGEPARTGADGSFELAAFAAGGNTITVNAPGYAEALVEKYSYENGLVEWGEIRLFRPQELRLAVHGFEESPSGATAWLAYTLQGFPLPKRHFDGAGHLIFADVPPGDHRVVVQERDGDYIRLHLALASGEDWDFRVGVGGPKHMTVRVLEEDGSVRTDRLLVLVGGIEDGHYVLRQDETPDDGQYHFAGIATDALDVSAMTPSGDEVAAKQVSLAGRDSLQVDLVIESSPLRVHVVDPDGEPLPAVRVRVRALDENRVLVVNNTASDGWVSLPGVPREACLVDAMHDSGIRLAVPIDASLREQELVLDPSSSLTLALKDGDVALAGVTTRVQTPDGTSLAAAMDTDADGTVRRDGLGEGAYFVACSRADCWPTSVRHELAAGEQAKVEVPMRRLASAELLVLGPEGLPVTGVAATLTSLEFKTDVSDWLAQGRVDSPTGLTSNPSGRILVEGLPNGAYGWSIALESGTSAGSLTLAPGENVRTLQLH